MVSWLCVCFCWLYGSTGVGVVQHKYETQIGCCIDIRNVESGEAVWFWSSSDMGNQSAWLQCVRDKWEWEALRGLDASSRRLYPFQRRQFCFILHLISKWQGRHYNQCPADVHRAAASPSGCVTHCCATSPFLSMEMRSIDAKEALWAIKDWSVKFCSLVYLLHFFFFGRNLTIGSLP